VKYFQRSIYHLNPDSIRPDKHIILSYKRLSVNTFFYRVVVVLFGSKKN